MVHFLGSPLTDIMPKNLFAQTKTAAIDKHTLFSLSTTHTTGASHQAGIQSVYYAALVEAQVHGSDSTVLRMSGRAGWPPLRCIRAITLD